jgi:hypothetical protein
MDYPKEGSTSVYDYSDKTIAHAGYAAIAFALVSVFTGALACIRYFLYHRPGTGGFQGHEQLHTAPPRNEFSVFATRPFRGLSLSRWVIA